MSVNILPIQDGYDTTLTSSLDAATGAGGYINVAAAPSATLPVGKTTTVRLDTGNTRAEEIEIDEIDVANKRLRIKTRNMTQGNGLTTSAQTHPAGASCIITFSYAQYSQLFNELAAYNGPLATYADEAARDAANPSPTNGQICYVTGTGAVQIRVGGNWENVATGDDEATTRQCTTAEAFNGEIFRDTGASNNLKYKSNAGVVYTLLVDSTGKLDSSVYDFSADTTGTETTKPVNAATALSIAVNAYAGTGLVGEVQGSVVAGSALCFEAAHLSEWNVDANLNLGDVSGNTRQAFSFIGSGESFASVRVLAQKILAPTDNLTIRFETDNAGAPSGTLFDANASGTIAGTGLSTLCATQNTVAMGGTVTPTRGTRYWVVYGRSGAVDAANYYQIRVATKVTRTNARRTWNGSAWASADYTYTPALGIVTGSPMARTVLVLATAANVFRPQVVGFSDGTYSAGATAKFRKGNGVALFSGLTSGVRYFLSDTAGSIATTPGTNFVPVGFSDNATTLSRMFDADAERQARDFTGGTPGTTITDYNNTTTYAGGYVNFPEYPFVRVTTVLKDWEGRFNFTTSDATGNSLQHSVKLYVNDTLIGTYNSAFADTTLNQNVDTLKLKRGDRILFYAKAIQASFPGNNEIINVNAHSLKHDTFTAAQ